MPTFPHPRSPTLTHPPRATAAPPRAAMLATSMFALEYAALGALVVVRNLAPLLAIGIEASITRATIRLDVSSVLSLVVVVVGVFLYVRDDIAASYIGVGDRIG